MYKNTKSMMSGAAMGVLAGSALGAVGAYAAQKHPREMKKAMKIAAHTAQKAMNSIDKMMSF